MPLLRPIASLLLVTPMLLSQTTSRKWANPPKLWHESAGELTETVPAGTDYWRTTHYGFVHDNGPFRYEMRAGNFEAKVHIRAQYQELYHQAGLMVRLDERNWIKTGIEFVNGHQNVSAVVTRDFSDWSVLPRTDNPSSVWIRLQRFNDTVQSSYSLDGQKWSMTRLAYFPPSVPVRIGMVAAAPGKQSFEVRFDHFSITELKAPPNED